MVTTGPKISSHIVTDDGSFETMTVGSTKYPFDLSYFPPGDYFIQRILLRFFNVRRNGIKCFFVDDSINKISKIFGSFPF